MEAPATPWHARINRWRWIVLYSGGFALTLLPDGYPSPARLLANFPDLVRVYYDARAVGRLAA